MKLLRLARGKFQGLAACSARGECPLLSFMNGLQGNLQNQADRMLCLLERVALVGPPRNTDICHQLHNEIWQFESGKIRVLWFYGTGRGIIVCSHAFVKATQKTPRRQINQALQVKRRYFQDAAREDLEILESEDEE